jgi:hypothetical protein
LDDWTTALSQEKALVFDVVVRQWECTFAMMSVALDDAISMRARGELVCARQQLSVAAYLLERLSPALISVCETLSTRGRGIGRLPGVAPLNAKFFRGDTGQSAASWNAIIHHVLFGNRARFFHKVRILSETVERLAREFDDVAADISRGLSVQPVDSWKLLDQLHYDFNTCLREIEIVFKSFLRTVPAGQLSSLRAELGVPPEEKPVPMRPRFSGASA